MFKSEANNLEKRSKYFWEGRKKLIFISMTFQKKIFKVASIIIEKTELIRTMNSGIFFSKKMNE